MVDAQNLSYSNGAIDNYILGDLLGSGTTSDVYEGTREGQEEIYAIKVLKTLSVGEREKQVQLLLKELNPLREC